jgi:hypothetical protein
MSYYIAPFNFDFSTSKIEVDVNVGSLDPLNPFYDVDCIQLYTAIKAAQASEEGIIYGQIGKGSGLNTLGPGVQVGLTVELLGAWQLRYPIGNYRARVAGGNLIGGPIQGPIAYSAGVNNLLIQSAASTVVNPDGTMPTLEQIVAAILAAAAANPIHADARRMNGATIHGTGAPADLWRGTP